MGGKTLKYPKRKKFVPQIKAGPEKEEKIVTPEEHEARLKVLREMGLIK